MIIFTEFIDTYEFFFLRLFCNINRDSICKPFAAQCHSHIIIMNTIDFTHSIVYNQTQEINGGLNTMATNLSIDTNLLETALKTGKLKTKRDTVNLALKEFIQRRKNADILSLFGTVEYSADYDYKKTRRREQ